MSRRQSKRTMAAREGYESRNPLYVRGGIWQDRTRIWVASYCIHPDCARTEDEQARPERYLDRWTEPALLSACLVTNRSRAPSFALEPLSRKDREQVVFVKLVADQHQWETGHFVYMIPGFGDLGGEGRCKRAGE